MLKIAPRASQRRIACSVVIVAPSGALPIWRLSTFMPTVDRWFVHR